MTDSDELFAFFNLVNIIYLFAPRIVLNESVLLFVLQCRELVVLQSRRPPKPWSLLWRTENQCLLDNAWLNQFYAAAMVMPLILSSYWEENCLYMECDRIFFNIPTVYYFIPCDGSWFCIIKQSGIVFICVELKHLINGGVVP